MKFLKVFLLLFLSVPCSAQVLTGVDVLQSSDFAALRGKRVGLITNPTGVNKNLVSTIDILSSTEAQAAGVELVALFAPEHGVRGDVPAGQKVPTTRDQATGAMVYSLYGNGMKPKQEMLQGLDALVFDIADIGSRSYTFISTLGLAIEAAGEAGIEFVVLDRPNPLGGVKVEGDGVKEGFSSFVSKYNVPYIHGMTVGELARLYVGEGYLKSTPKRLTIIAMQGWMRGEMWDKTGLLWVPTSPHIPQWTTSIHYPITGMIGELQTLNIGVGYTLPFELFGAEWIGDAEGLARRLNGRGIAGVIFRPIHYKPFYGSGKDKYLHGVQVHISDFSQAPLTLIGLYVLEEVISMYPQHNPFLAASKDRISMYDKVLGSSELRLRFMRDNYRLTTETIKWWQSAPATFAPIRQKYLIY